MSKQEIGVLRTFQALAAGIFTTPAQISEAHARHIHLYNNCLSTLTGQQSYNVKGFVDDDLNFNQDKTATASGLISMGQTPSFVRGLRDFADLGLDDKEVRDPEDDAVSIASRDTGSEVSSEASFADVSSVESGCRGRSGHVKERSASSMSKTYKKTRRTAARKDELFSDSEDEIEKPSNTEAKPLKQTDMVKKDVEKSVYDRAGTGVRFNVQEPDVVNAEGGVSRAQMERSLTKDSLYSAHTRGSSVTIPLGEEGKLTTKLVFSFANLYFSFICGVNAVHHHHHNHHHLN